MPSETGLTIEAPEEQALPEYQPEKYWAVWQLPEGRYAYMIDWNREGWLLAMDSEEAGQAYLQADARQNRRDLSLYRLDELTLPEAFEAVRAQPIPFSSSYGTPVLSVKGVEIRTLGLRGTRRLRRVPM